MITMAGQLNIGWGKRSLAPDFPVPIPGQFYMRVSLGTYTPVLASALVLENGEDQVIFVSCDMVSVDPDVLLKVQALLAAEVPALQGNKLIINATHTHAGPGSRDVGDYPRNVEMKEGEELRIFLARQIADAVKEAWEKRAPGSIAYGYGFATTGHRVNININEECLISRLHRNGYRYDEKIYYKKVVGDRFDEYSYDQYYYTFILNVKDNFNYNEYLCVLDKGFNIHNIGFIFIVDNDERILKQVKEYIKNTIIDTQTKYKYKKFFVPIIILNDSVYYFEYKTGIFLTKYGQALDEGLKILDIK